MRFVLRGLLFAALVFAVLMSPLSMSRVAAQGGNLLENPGFEGGYVAVGGEPNRLVAPGWQAWNVAPQPSDPTFIVPPDYRSAQNASRVVGGAGQEIFAFFGSFTGGVLQRVNVTPGSVVRFSITANVWSSELDDQNVSQNPGAVGVSVGIDPTGGLNGDAETVVYSEPQTFYDSFRTLTVETTAQSGTITVFVRGAFTDPKRHNNLYVDDASLVVTQEAVATPTTEIVPTREGTPVPTLNIPTARPTNTQVPGGTAAPSPTLGFNGQIEYTVTFGDTLSGIAVRFGSTVEAIQAANNLTGELINVGQVLIIPVQVTPTPTAQATQPPAQGGGQADGGGGAPVDFATLTGPTVNGIGTYILQPGDTLERVALRYGITVAELARINGIVNPNAVVVGQVLVVPGPGNNVPGGTIAPTVIAATATFTPSPTAVARATYTVQPGDNLFRIAVRFNVPVDVLQRVNGIVNPNIVYVGQVLVIP